MNAKRPNHQLMLPFAAPETGEARVPRRQGVEAIKTTGGAESPVTSHDSWIRRRRGVSASRMIEEMTTCLRGWLGCFGRGEDYWTLRDLDSWIRRRRGAAAWRAWRLPRKRFRQLVRRGATFGEAAIAVRRFRNPWRASLDRALTVALPESLWTKLGLLNLQTQWRVMNT